MKKIILLVSILLLTGCADYVEINDLLIIGGIIIDYKDNNYVLTTELISTDKLNSTKVITTTSATIEEALSKISTMSNKDLFLSHMKVLILTKDAIKNDKEIFDYFLRSSKSKMNFYVYIIDDDLQDKIFNIKNTDTPTSLYIEKMMKFNNKIYSSSTPLSFIDLIYKKYEKGIVPIYPKLNIKKNNNEEIIYLDGLIILNNDKEIRLNDTESIYYNILISDVDKTIIDIPCNNEIFTLAIKNIKTKYKYNNNEFLIEVNFNSDITSYRCNYDLDSTSTINKLNTLSNHYIKEKLTNIINKNNESDFIGIGNYIYKHNKNFKLKDNYLKDINIKIDINNKINSIGELRK